MVVKNINLSNAHAKIQNQMKENIFIPRDQLCLYQQSCFTCKRKVIPMNKLLYDKSTRDKKTSQEWSKKLGYGSPFFPISFCFKKNKD